MGLYTDLISEEKKESAPQQQPKFVPSIPQNTQPKSKQLKSTHARKQPSKLVTKYKNVLAAKQPGTQIRTHGYMRAYLDKILIERATNGFTFRYPPELLEQLEDILYEVKKQHKKKLPKNAVAVMALAYILKDYVENGDESVFYRIFIADREN